MADDMDFWLNSSSSGGDDDWENSEVYLFKRTFASAGAAIDGDFVMRNLGLELETNLTYDSAASGVCAHRSVLRALSDWELHYYESHVTSQGRRTVEDWVDYWIELLGDISAEGALAKWSEFSSQIVSFYTPDLSPFVLRLAETGVPSLRLRSLDAAGATVFSLFIVAPRSGHLLQISSDKLSTAPRHEFSFNPLADAPAAACSPSLRLPVAATVLRAYWDALGGSLVNGRGLPDLLAVGLTLPVSEAVESTAKFLRDFTGKQLRVSAVASYNLGAAADEDDTAAAAAAAAGGGGQTSPSSSTSAAVARQRMRPRQLSQERQSNNRTSDRDGRDLRCEVQRITIPYQSKSSASLLGASSSVPYPLTVAVVRNRAAVVGSWSLAEWEEDVQAAHTRLVGCDAGWDRYVR